MAILPATMHPDWWADEDYDSLGLGPYFNHTIHNNRIHGIRHDDVLAHYMPFSPPHILQQYIQEKRIPKSAYKDQFHALLDIQHFMPYEITVKVVDKFVLVEGKHKEKQDEHGSISRNFSRKYLVPEQYDHEEVISSLSSDGVLTITAHRKYDPKHHREKHIGIEISGKPMKPEILEAKKEEKKPEKHFTSQSHVRIRLSNICLNSLAFSIHIIFIIFKVMSLQVIK